MSIADVLTKGNQ